ncbi:hypothetical protein D477_002653 [Arthrobacter crystallopoietes BAB-32]|uniref:Uncharacterized protein n=1 Tax=Arthrobacter crystallopoietes BAB-32 TaxID=1246476 RepID=N1V6N6_9MICC|nr:hypothetical protein [Arthrobacter crystallopoietes]EMY35757.1 hypothetical protein D477_002653 [Arthrobacter crystallopoietes BAB-32]
MVNEIVAVLPTCSLLPPDYVRWTEAEISGDPLAHKWPIHRLTATELATLRVRIEGPAKPTENHDGTVAGWVAHRLRVHAERGKLLGRSSSDLAREMWDMFFSGPRPKYPYRGFDVLRCVDEAAEATGVSVWIDAAPTKDDPYSYRPMRFSDRLAELEGR